MRTLREITPRSISNWAPSAGSGTINPAFSSDSGAYWCEDGDGLRSSALNISVTAGSVILESPVLPVKEGVDVTMYCKKNKSPGDLIADFYKDGVRIRTSYKGNLIIYNVSTSDEGLYKCHNSGSGESAESLLSVRERHEEETPSPPPPKFPTVLWIVVPVLLVALLLFVFVCGVLHCKKHKVSRGESLVDPNNATYAVVKKPRRGTVLGGDDVVDSHQATYADIQKPRKEKVTGGGDLVDPHHVTYAMVKRKEKEPKISKASTKPRLPEESTVYSAINIAVGRADTPD
ncbi:low affinity immunoglobulin gamma Fc region receptor II-a-like [Anoplopoma fimbria]|uniref:low affinity immunoglobulin gamma Fc region receptor II-a-like n=1 Tax=Anoplopoma fimbria TaxID=229290 RepID=UPI0023ED3E18|nr:low affinity immunoglobulin gamma Fc region receptor II-a-like [Anoplopoma fimbria]